MSASKIEFTTDQENGLPSYLAVENKYQIENHWAIEQVLTEAQITELEEMVELDNLLSITPPSGNPTD